MKRILLLAIGFASTLVLACEEIVSPSWFLLDTEKNPVAVTVFETSGREKLELIFDTKAGRGYFELIKPPKGYKWVYGACTLNKTPDIGVFALVKIPDKNGWSPEIKAAYKINLNKRSIEKLNNQSLYCFATPV
jgi:hypothetical protein